MIHDDGDALDALVRLFEGHGFEVVTAVSAFRAQAILESDRVITIVVAPWDSMHPVGGETYRWSLLSRYDLRDQFVFLADQVPDDFDRVVGGRCLAVPLARPGELIRIAQAAVKRRAELESHPPVEELDRRKPTLMLVEDEPILLDVMTGLLGEAGFAVAPFESGLAAIAQLDHDDFDVVVIDWAMDEGSGEDVFRWIQRAKPWLVDRIVFLTGSDGEVEHVQQAAPDMPIFRKGADAAALIAALTAIARSARHANDADTVRPGSSRSS